MVAVVHQDDETLWAFDFITKNPGVHVACCHVDRRPGKELRIERFYRACEAMGAVPFVVAGHSGTWDVDTRPIVAFARDYDLIVTHNEIGEYGHPAHKALHYALAALGKPMKVFGAGLAVGSPIDWAAKQRVLELYEDPALIPWIRKQGIDLSCEALHDLS